MDKKIKIAVCLYGQARKMEYTSSYIKKFYDEQDCEIDYFCSTKSYLEWLSDFRKKGNVDNLNTQELKKSIENIYNPKSIRIIDKNVDDIHDYGLIQKVHYALIDSILLKSKYEAENNFEYDFTILQRYDSIIIPFENSLNDIIKKMIHISETSNQNNICYIAMKDKHHGSLINMAQDIVFIANGNSLDIIAAELLKYVGRYKQKCENENTKPYLIRNIHLLLFDIFSKNNLQTHKINEDMKINSIIIRDGLEDHNLFESDTHAKYIQLWVETQNKYENN